MSVKQNGLQRSGGPMEAGLEIFPFDAAAYLDTPETIAVFLTEAFETGDAAFISHAIGVVGRAKGMSALSRETGLSRESLYKALSPTGNPELATIMKVLKALGLRLSAELSEGSEESPSVHRP
jgi:probable addiction module antidote protein